MKYYYLISQLPDITNVEKVNQISESYYRNLCERFLSSKHQKVLSSLSLIPPQKEFDTGSNFLNSWYDNDRNLRFALAQIRAQKMKKDSGMLPLSCTQDIMQAARTAVGMDSPLSAEMFLYEYRMDVLNKLRSYDIFSIDAVYEYGIRLLLTQRMKQFNKEAGKISYRKIYNSIIGDKND